MLWLALGAVAVVVAGFGVWLVSFAMEGRLAMSETSESSHRRTVAVVGDSNTEADSPDFAGGRIGEGSWVHALLAEPTLEFAGGWALAGSTSVDQAVALSSVPALGGPDELVVMTGTNDLTYGLEFAVTERALDVIVDRIAARRVTVLAIPPRDDVLAAAATEFNARLALLAGERGWDFLDGFTGVRMADGTFRPGTTTDGIHLSRELARQLGERVAEHLVSRVS